MVPSNWGLCGETSIALLCSFLVSSVCISRQVNSGG